MFFTFVLIASYFSFKLIIWLTTLKVAHTHTQIRHCAWVLVCTLVNSQYTHSATDMHLFSHNLTHADSLARTGFHKQRTLKYTHTHSFKEHDSMSLATRGHKQKAGKHKRNCMVSIPRHTNTHTHTQKLWYLNLCFKHKPGIKSEDAWLSSHVVLGPVADFDLVWVRNRLGDLIQIA